MKGNEKERGGRKEATKRMRRKKQQRRKETRGPALITQQVAQQVETTSNVVLITF